MNKKKKETLADKISSILTSAPTNFDPEDVSDVTTAPLVFDENEDVDYNETEEKILSKFRKENVDLLADVDNKYAGKRASRKSLKDSDDDSSEGDSVNEENEEEEASNNSASEEEDEPNSYSEEDSESGSDDDEDDEDEFGDTSLIENETINDPNFKHLNDSDSSTQLKKAVCVRNQMSIWENLLEVRIQLQKSLITANKMPQKESFSRIKQQLDPEFSTKLAETKQNLSGVLNKLLNLQELVLKQFPETKKLESTAANTKTTDDDDDEEIPSDTDPENCEIEEEEEESTNKPPAGKKRKLEDYERDIKQQHNKYKKYRDSVIQKWNDKARVAQKNNTNSHSILNQIEYNLSNKEKLIKRTQFKRSQYEILGKEEHDSSANSPEEELDSEIFDDDDFYHQLLRELIEVKSADVTDPVQLGRQWIQLQNLRSKMKRKIDTKATKGRKIRYAIHTKLVNFMAPIDEHAWTDEAKTELYNSLFSKNQIN